MKLAQPVVGKPGVDGKAGVDYHSSARAINYFSVLNLSRAASAYRATITYRNSNNYHAGGGQEIQFSQYEKINLAAAGKWMLAKHDTLQAMSYSIKAGTLDFLRCPWTSVTQDQVYIVNVPARCALIFPQITAKAYHNRITHSMDDTHRKDVAIHMICLAKRNDRNVYRR
jgi:iron complex outermembrane receptor protein